MEITEIMQDAINRYFKSLSLLGYYNYDNVYNLIWLSMIEEILTGPLSVFITEDDYKIIVKGLNCICANTCIIDLPEYNVYDDIIHDIKTKTILRESEDNILRSSLKDFLRVKA